MVMEPRTTQSHYEPGIERVDNGPGGAAIENPQILCYTRPRGVADVGLTHVELSIANPAKPKRSVRLSLLVDSGAVYSVVPASLLRKQGIQPHSRSSYTLANGTEDYAPRRRRSVSCGWPSRSLAGNFWREGRQHFARQCLSGSPWFHPGPA